MPFLSIKKKIESFLITMEVACYAEQCLTNYQRKNGCFAAIRKKIAETILKDPVMVIQMSATDLAAEAGSSSAAVIRFCRSIGVKGFTELKLQLSADSQGIKDNLYTDILSEENLEQVKKKMLINTNHLFKETNNVLDTKQIERVSELLHESSVIYLYGLGASHIVASDIQQKFSRMGKMVVCSLDQHLLVTSMAVAGKNAVFFGVSNSGEKRSSGFNDHG